MARPKKPSAELASIEDANRALHSLLIAEVELEKQQGAMDLARAEAITRYEKQIDAQRSVISDLTLQLQTWYMSNHRDLEKDGLKSLKLAHGTVGRRIGNPELKPLNRSWTWSAIAVKLRSIYNSRFFRTQEPQIDRQLVRAELTSEQLAAVGLKVDQEERFYVETDRSSIE